MYRFLVVIEKANKNYSAYSPDLPGCISTGATREEAERNMHEAIEMHVRGLLDDGLPIPESHSFAEYAVIQYPGPGYKKYCSTDIDAEVYDRALRFVSEQLVKWRAAKRSDLALRYTLLASYFEHNKKHWT